MPISPKKSPDFMVVNTLPVSLRRRNEIGGRRESIKIVRSQSLSNSTRQLQSRRRLTCGAIVFVMNIWKIRQRFIKERSYWTFFNHNFYPLLSKHSTTFVFGTEKNGRNIRQITNTRQPALPFTTEFRFLCGQTIDIKLEETFERSKGSSKIYN